LPAIERDRCLGLSYLILSQRTREPAPSEAYRLRALEILERVRQEGMRDPETDAALATIHQRANPDRAIELGQLALRYPNVTPEIRVKALTAIGMAQISAGRTDEAISPFGFLVGLRRQATDWYLLAVCRFQAGDIPGALAAAQRAAEIRPDNPKAHELLAELYRQNGQTDRAEQADKMNRLTLEARKRAN
jgi:Flp pilus assembly protein TadD